MPNTVSSVDFLHVGRQIVTFLDSALLLLTCVSWTDFFFTEGLPFLDIHLNPSSKPLSCGEPAGSRSSLFWSPCPWSLLPPTYSMHYIIIHRLSAVSGITQKTHACALSLCLTSLLRVESSRDMRTQPGLRFLAARPHHAPCQSQKLGWSGITPGQKGC